MERLRLLVEGVNNKIRVLQRRAYGYRDEEYLKLKIVAAFLPPLPRNAVFNPVLSKNTNELKTGAPGRFDRVVSKNTNELKTGAPVRRRVSSIIMMESATIKGLATRLCFWTRRRWRCCAGVFYHLPSTTTEKKWRLEQ